MFRAYWIACCVILITGCGPVGYLPTAVPGIQPDPHIAHPEFSEPSEPYDRINMSNHMAQWMQEQQRRRQIEEQSLYPTEGPLSDDEKKSTTDDEPIISDLIEILFQLWLGSDDC